jgi:uroporphyrin-III C-methyltransferase
MNTSIDPLFFSPGEVALIGAGPGDPELLTLKAAKYLRHADVVLVDDLVNPLILEHCHSQARIIHVGKRGGCHSTPQSFIEKIMIRAALSGLRVARLKGGDPLIFGRAGEEIEALHAQRIKVTVVNGISAGLAGASAFGVSLTHRHHSPGVIFVTGHLKDEGAQPNWRALAESGMTLVIYMGLARAALIQQNLLNSGLSGNTPVGLIKSATYPDEKLLRTHLAAMCETIEAEQLTSPAIILIGDILQAASQLHHFSAAA